MNSSPNHAMQTQRWRDTHKEQYAQSKKRWRCSHLDLWKGYCRKHNYGITQSEFDAMLKVQNNKCAICGKPFTSTPCVDHDHKMGKVRGLLCRACNRAIGMMGDNPETLVRAIRYLEGDSNES